MDETSVRSAASAPAATPAPAAAGAQGAQATATETAPHRESSVKETIESILIAFILAFIFRAFVVEAFVIPTGSMATTLMGAHMRFRCPDCGYRFEVNYSARQGQGDDITIPSHAGPEQRRERYMGQERIVLVNKVYDVRCPNCAYQIPTPDTTNPEVNYGDRILVLKYLYLFQQPRRWDVVVFKSPDDVPAYQQNYIKRLIGNPNESVVILDGDIYIGKEGQDLTQYQIQAKPRYVQESLWRNIYNNDYFPLGLARMDPWRQPWTVTEGSGWSGPAKGATPTDVANTRKQQRFFAFDNLSGKSTIKFDPNANPTQAFTDYLVYDIEGPSVPPNPVSDLKLSFFYERRAGDGPLRLAMSKGPDVFTVQITNGRATMTRSTRGGAPTTIGETAVSTSGAVEVELTNHDYQVNLRIGGKDVITTTREQYHPDVKQLLADFEAGRPGAFPTVEISAENQ
ncbi:MAG TPA: signal peptidase I, partial [Tepidisphaeraceae bacterium]